MEIHVISAYNWGVGTVNPGSHLIVSEDDMTPLTENTICICRKPDCNIPYGFCHCGCEAKTPICPMTKASMGHVRGMPFKYIRGHQKRQKRKDLRGVGHFKIDGVYCRLIALTQQQYAICEEVDYERLSKRMWQASYDSKMRSYYAVSYLPMVNGKQDQQSMHREVMGLSIGDTRKIDHCEPMATTINIRSNLRFATSKENSYNQRCRTTNTSGRKGVCPDNKGFMAYIRANGKFLVLCRRRSFEEACAIRSEAEKKYHGKFARSK
jgi:hypothetical protein